MCIWCRYKSVVAYVIAIFVPVFLFSAQHMGTCFKQKLNICVFRRTVSTDILYNEQFVRNLIKFNFGFVQF